MTYRDEQEALRAQNDALRRQLNEARREIARLQIQLAASADSLGPERHGACFQPLTGDRASMRPGFLVALFLCMLGAVVLARAVRRGCPYASSGHATHWSPGWDAAAGAYHGVRARPFFRGEQWQGRLTHLTGSVAGTLDAGSRCTVRVIPASVPRFNCRVEVDCGGVRLYGDPRTGYNWCSVEQERPARAYDLGATDRDGDPRLDMDLRAGSVVIGDDGAQSPFTAAIALDASP